MPNANFSPPCPSLLAAGGGYQKPQMGSLSTVFIGKFGKSGYPDVGRGGGKSKE
jgi:hypothetical protein